MKKTAQIYVRITKGTSGKDRDTIATATPSIEEAIKFIKQHA